MEHSKEPTWHDSYAASATSTYGAECLVQKTLRERAFAALVRVFPVLGYPIDYGVRQNTEQN